MKEIVELGYGECRFIVADEPVRLYCAEPVVGVSSWCPTHYQICFIRNSREPTRKAAAPAKIVAPSVLETAAPVTLVLRWPS
jgi:hypothetical protein